jgi:hypothetical protein
LPELGAQQLPQGGRQPQGEFIYFSRRQSSVAGPERDPDTDAALAGRERLAGVMVEDLDLRHEVAAGPVYFLQ